jgi:hypothetical protein
VGLGWHRLSISQPKFVPFEKRLFVFYGEHDLGKIVLSRERGLISIHANPAAQTLRVNGPEYSATFTNSFGLTSSIPMDTYVVEAQYAHGTERSQTVVEASHEKAPIIFGAKLGTLQLTSTVRDARFSMYRGSGEFVLDGVIPKRIEQLPEGLYSIKADLLGNVRELTITILPKQVVETNIVFFYGTAKIESDPPEASVWRGSEQWGTTPLLATNVSPGELRFTLKRHGYHDLQISTIVAANETNYTFAQLTNFLFPEALKELTQAIESTNLQSTTRALSDAFDSRPYDQARGQGNSWTNDIIALSKLEIENNYEAAWELVQTLLKTVEPNTAAKLENALKCRKAEAKAERIREQAKHIKSVYLSAVSAVQNSDPFEDYQTQIARDPEVLQASIKQALETQQPRFHVSRQAKLGRDCFVIEADEVFPDGMRKCVLVLGPKEPGICLIFFRVLELLPPNGGVGDWVPITDQKGAQISPEKEAQIRTGIETISSRLKGL